MTIAYSATFKQFGPPTQVIKVQKVHLPPIKPDQVLIRFLAFPINPSDINAIQGTYAILPEMKEEGAIPGIEGLAMVDQVGSHIKHLTPGTFVLPCKPAFGTWRTAAIASESQLIPINRTGISDIMAATISVNPCTAYRMLKDFVPLKKGDVVVQNGANSAVGQAVIQFCRIQGIKTVNVVRNRENINELKASLMELGADIVIADDQLRDGEILKKVKALGPAVLGLNCVGGTNGLSVSRMLSKNGIFVTYGGMSQKPVMMSTADFIFKNIQARGYWMTQWYAEHSMKERQDMMNAIFDHARQGTFKEPYALMSEWNLMHPESFETLLQKAIQRAISGYHSQKEIIMIK